MMIGAGLLLGAFLTARGPQPWEHANNSDEEAGPITVWPGTGGAALAAAEPAMGEEENSPLLQEVRIIENKANNVQKESGVVEEEAEDDEEEVLDGPVVAGNGRITDEEEALASGGEGTS